MSTVAKKRTTETITQVEQINNVVPKRLRLVYNTPAEDLRQSFDKCKNNKDVFELLNDVEFNSSKLDTELISDIINVLFEKLATEKKEIIRDVLCLLIDKMISRNVHNSGNWVKPILNALIKEESNSVKFQLLNILNMPDQKTKLDDNSIKQILNVAKKGLNSKNHGIRCRSLNLIGRFSSDKSKLGLDDLLSFTADPDWRVRSAAFKNILLWHERGLVLDMNVYMIVRKGLNDFYEMVKLDSLKIISAIAILTPDYMVTNCWSAEASNIRLVDACFMDLCDAFNDSCIKVRLEAALLLGHLKMVSLNFLMQTLDKKLMSDMRVKKSAHEKNRRLYDDSSEFSSGSKFGADAPREIDECPSLVPIGACGAFVHGLEDEFLCVRSASIDSLCQLTLANHCSTQDDPNLQTDKFAMQCGDFLVDMFNDEIDEVRLKAVKALAKISHLFVLRDEQLDFIISILKDYFNEIRESTHEFLSHCNPATRKTFSTIVHSLIENINKYPADKFSIWSCMKEMGQIQNKLVLSLITELMSIHPFFETKEHELDDPSYIGVLVLVFNALQHCDTMLANLPPFLTRHYIHVRNTLPHLIPDINAGQFLMRIKELNFKHDKDADILGTVFKRIEVNLRSANFYNILTFLALSIRDLKKILDLVDSLKDKLECQLLYFQSYLWLYKLLYKLSNRQQSVKIQMERDPADDFHYKKAINFFNKLENCFTNLNKTDLEEIHNLKLKLKIAGLFNRGNTVDLTNSSKPSDADDRGDLSKIADRMRRRCDATGSGGTDDVDALVAYLRDSRDFKLLTLADPVDRVWVELDDNTLDEEITYHFLPNMILALPLSAHLHNFSKTDNFRIVVEYPDGTHQLILPQASHFKYLSSKLIKLTTNAFISHHYWTDACKIRIGMAAICNDGLPSASDRSDDPVCTVDRAELRENLVVLTKPVGVTVHPSFKRDKHHF